MPKFDGRKYKLFTLFRSLPDWAQYVMKYHFDDLNRIITQQFLMWTETQNMKKIKAGYFLKEVLDRFLNKSKSLLHPDRTLWIYSGHDNSIINVLNSLNCFHKVIKDKKSPVVRLTPQEQRCCETMNGNIHWKTRKTS